MRSKWNNGQWTAARFNSFVKSALRSASKRWPPKYECLSEAKQGKKINAKSGRMAEHYKCAKCSGEFTANNVQVDHINPLIPVTGFTTWDDVVNNMFCEKDNLQVLCLDCHKKKTQQEKEERKKYGN